MNRWKCVCSYDGTDFAGWQKQPTRDAVQDVIEHALSKVLKMPVQTQGSGRTDAGVHALAQVFHFDSDWTHSGPTLVTALQTLLPSSVRIQSAEVVEKDFHARYSATGKCYHYRIFMGRADPFETRYCLSIPHALNVDLIKEAGNCLLGEHDFSAFAAETGEDSGKDNPVKKFRKFETESDGDRLRLSFEASGFMYKMVRSLTGALIRVGRGKLSPSSFRQILVSQKRTKDVVTAHPRGLFLEKVFY